MDTNRIIMERFELKLLDVFKEREKIHPGYGENLLNLINTRIGDGSNISSIEYIDNFLSCVRELDNMYENEDSPLSKDLVLR